MVKNYFFLIGKSFDESVKKKKKPVKHVDKNCCEDLF